MLLAAAFAIALGVSPPATRVAFAAETLRLQADATYTLDPGAGRVHVEIDARATNLKPNSASFIYFYREIGFPLQREASRIRASDSIGSISITTKKHEFYIETVVRLRAPIYYKDSSNFTIRYDLVGGDPRSDSPTRVGLAFATFGVWAWGDPGRSTVTVHTPRGFGSEVAGDPLTIKTGTDGQHLSASPSDPDTFYSIVSSENCNAYEGTRLSLEGGAEVVVLAWPEDDVWATTTRDLLSDGIPELRRLIGLPWPVTHDLNVFERYTPALEGYAGIFFTDDQHIDVSEDLDPVVIVHEASHAWLNQSLFKERWIYEGLAEEYAWQVLDALGNDANVDPERPDPKDPGHITLARWSFPQVIRDEETDDRERYGYGAAFWVLHTIVQSAGGDQMRAAFAAARGDKTAYPGAPAPERVAPDDDWRRLIDLVEPIDGADAPEIEAALRQFALESGDGGRLDARDAARVKYRALLTAGNGWLPPWTVRAPMGTWAFDTATKAIDAASAVLVLRNDVAAAAEALGLTPDDALRTAYESTKDGFDASTTIANDQLAALAAISEARMKVDAEPDLLTQVGLIGATPRAPYDEARTAFEAGDLDGAVRLAGDATTLINGAAAIGQSRLVTAVSGVAIALLLLLIVAILLRRRGRRRRQVVAAALATTEPTATWPAATEPVATEPYATLAADPEAAPDTAPSPPANPPDDEGGPAH